MAQTDDINVIVDDIWNTLIKAAAQGEKDTNKILHNAANTFLIEYADIRKQLSVLKEMLEQKQKLSKLVLSPNANSSVEQLMQIRQDINYILNGPLVRRMYHITDQFQKVLLSVLGRKLTMVVVHDFGNGPELYEIVDDNLLKFDIHRGQIVGRYTINEQTLKTSLKKIELDNNFHFDMQNLKATYTETIRRYNISREHKNHVVLYKIDGVWNVFKVSAAGDINEAYAAVVFQNREHPTFESDMEINIQDFLNSFVAEVDNMSGMLAGDITIGNLEYGIKSLGASTMGLKQFETLAKEILAVEVYDQESLQKKADVLQTKAKTRNRLIGTISNIAENDLLREIINKI